MLLVLLASALALVACTEPSQTKKRVTSGSSGNGSGDDDGDADDAVPAGSKIDGSAYMREYCRLVFSCHPSLRGVFASEAECVATYMPRFELNRRDPDDGATQARVDACVAALARSSCNDDIDVDACRWPGKRKAGAACGNAAQCETGSCVFGQNADCGVCTALGQVGASCGLTECASGLLCDGSRCVERTAEGGACASRWDCASGLVCAAGRCAKPTPAGGTCTPPADLSGAQEACARPLQCVSGTCQLAERPVAMLGGSCAPDPVTNERPICRASDCNETSDRCVVEAKAGEACSDDATDALPGCSAPLHCRRGRCVLVDYSECK